MEQILVPSNFFHSPETSKCKRTGICCRLFAFTGVCVTDREWDTLEPEIKSLNLPAGVFDVCKSQKTLPIIGEAPPKKCAFLEGLNKCRIYSKRPLRCREYPVMIDRGKKAVVLHISSDCLRGEEIARTIKLNPSDWITELVGDKKVDIVLDSFFEKNMCRYNNEEL